ncbi:hypothetical protein F8388_000211 [Cannabis sativa]|uniref:DUF7054 domain-containing protein n=1 Tax=Cannabis sativa TaxID=3483 RepID=A0A7J6F2Y9_CANSA|nr:hypothetical protein F8388_000211 [Cannabis sativa]
MFGLKLKKNSKKRLMLISISFIGSPGPMKLLVDEDELVISVIRTALKYYAQQQRRPILGTNVHDFILYYPNFDSLNPLDKIGSKGVSHNFVLYKKQKEKRSSNTSGHGGLRIWKVWMQRKECAMSNKWPHLIF